MKDNDLFKKAFAALIEGMDVETLAEIKAVTFNAETQAVVKELTKCADYLTQHFDPYVVVAALEIVMNDYQSLVGDDE